ncbi:exodeoxyribonuclease VII small subunit [Gemella sp. GH3]|uniref:exodeoxyribonuclease VII small subunit n=1 Tax=unclassified Gemella TaxID=2624949 RepID=UPI0015D047A7|nr:MULTISPECIES: exodeoxyribonuclease VII small subunit [unclassified Gemella]MBF0713304.1 exodeoxyribonuclease VII small subunit [Gemella sp. GH3.1]NYS50256.1 exodeoxyribonuclease VII small subunit [Gemella sp. GH3]
MTKEKQEINFEYQMQKLEEIINKLENNELSLNDALEQYKNGVQIIKNCNSIIDEAEKKVAEFSKELENE